MNLILGVYILLSTVLQICDYVMFSKFMYCSERGAAGSQAWRKGLLLGKPATLLGWYRELFRLMWKRKSAGRRKPARHRKLRAATPFAIHPKYLIRDNDSKFGPQFAHLHQGLGQRIPVPLPDALSSRNNRRLTS